MKVECVKEKLTWAISKTERIAGKNLSLPILSCVLLETQKNSLIIRATNLDLGIEITIPVKVLKEGKVAIPAHVFYSFLSNIPNDKNIILETTDTGTLKVTTPKTSTTIKTLPNDDFPLIPEVSDENSFRIKGSEIAKALKAVWYSCAVSSVKPELSSVYMKVEDDTLVCAATDSFRLAEKKIKIKKGRNIESLLIPQKNIPEILRSIEEINEEILFCFTKTQISFAYDGLYLTSRVIDGIFPDYKQIVPKEGETEAVVLKDELVQNLKVVNIFSDKFNQVNIKASPTSKVLELKTSNGDVGESVNNVDAALTGKDIAVNFNFKYITDSFQSIDSDSLSLSFNGLNRPLVIRGVGDSSFLYLVMPMNK